MAGTFLITEVMFDPSTSDNTTEWFEITNITNDIYALNGLTIRATSNTANVVNHVIKSNVGIYMNGGEYAVLVINRQAARDLVHIDATKIKYEYAGNIKMTSDTGSKIEIFNLIEPFDAGEGRIAIVNYGGWFSNTSGKSIQMKEPLSFPAGENSAKWCQSSNAWADAGALDKGTPGFPSDCP